MRQEQIGVEVLRWFENFLGQIAKRRRLDETEFNHLLEGDRGYLPIKPIQRSGLSRNRDALASQNFTQPLDEQRRIVAYLDGLQAKVDALRKLQLKSGEELSALMPSILDKAFKGELKATTTIKPRRIFITAEDNSNIDQPGSSLVLSTDD